MPEGRKKILIVEDESVIALYEAELLRGSGYDVIIASTGDKAMYAVLSDDSIDLIVMDIDLGVEEDGIDLMKKIHLCRDIPVIFLSNHTEKKLLERIEEISSLGFICKNSGDTAILASLKIAFNLLESYAAYKNSSNELIKNQGSAQISEYPDHSLPQNPKNKESLQDNDLPLCRSFEKASFGIAYISPAGNVLISNKYFDSIIGFDKSSIDINIFNRTIFPDNKMKWDEIQTILSNNSAEAYTFEKLIHKPGSKTVWLKFSITPSRDDSNTIHYYIMIIEDISEWKEEELRLKKIESLYNLITENSEDVIWFYDAEIERFSFISPSIYNLRGYTPQEAMSQPLEKSLTPESCELFKAMTRQNMGNILTGNKNSRAATTLVDQPHKNGSIIHTEAITNLIIDDENKLAGILGISRNLTQRQKIALELHTSHLLLKRAQSIARLGYYIIDLRDKTVSSSDEAKDIYGLSEGPLPLSVIQAVPLPEYRDMLNQKLADLIGGKDSYDVEFKIRKPSDGAIIDIHSVAQYDEAQKKVFGIIQNITELKITQEQLKASEEKYRRITGLILDYIYSVRIENGHVIETSHGAGCFPVTGYTTEEFARDPYLWFNMIYDPDKSAVETKSRKILEGGSVNPFVHRIVKPDGTIRWVKNTIMLHKDSRGILTGYDGLVEDITESRNLEQALKESEQKFRHLVENMTDVLWQTSADHSYTYISPTDKIQRGYNKNEVIGHSFLEFISPESLETITHLSSEHRELIKRGERLSDTFFAVKQLTKNGGEIWCEIISNPIYDEAGVLTGFQGITRDITQRKNTEIALEKALKEKEDLLRELNHRVKNSLSMITGLVGLEKSQTKSPELKKIFDTLRSRIITIANLYSMLDAKKSTEELSLNQYLKTITDSIYKSYVSDSTRIQINTNFSPISIDVKRAATIGLILNELLTNAFKYAFAGKGNTAEVSLSEMNDLIILEVSDNGKGLPKNFDIKGENGLGMRLILMFAEQMGGSVSCVSSGGTRFTVTLPKQNDSSV